MQGGGGMRERAMEVDHERGDDRREEEGEWEVTVVQ